MLKKKPKTKKKTSRKAKAKSFLKLFLIRIKDKAGATDTVPKVQHISLMNGDEVEWRAKGSFTVVFDGSNGSPFDATSFAGSDGHPANSGPPVNAQPNVSYKYTAQFDGDTPEDPIIHTDP